MSYATITLASHHFVVTGANDRVRAAMREFSKSLCLPAKTYKDHFGNVVKSGKDKYYAAFTRSRSEVRYHINHLEDFKKVLYRHRLDGEGMIEWKTQSPYEAAAIDLVIQPHLSDRPHQIEPIEYITNPLSPIAKAIIMQMGKGKTYTAMRGASLLAERVCVVLGPKYISQWLRDFKQNCVINPKRIVVIKGSKDLKSLLAMAANGPLPYDVVIVSSVTFRNYITEYEELEKDLENEGYEAPPAQFFQHIKAGLRLIDEGHENFHFVFKLDLYTHVHHSITLSATLFNDNDFTNRMIEVAYPKALRFDKGGFDKYVHAYSLHYSFRNPREIKCMGSMGYNHIEFEKSLLKKKDKLEAYFGMVRENLRYTYDLDYREGDKCLIYFAFIETCTLFTAWLKKHYPKLDIRRYAGSEGDPFENLMEADISVSTTSSAGTGKDIPRLTTVILTVNINASPSNLQGFGRLRDLNLNLEVKDRKMYFVYFVGDDFVKHVEYHENKKELLRTRALSYEPRYYGTMI